jgi:hypothetical protein
LNHILLPLPLSLSLSPFLSLSLALSLSLSFPCSLPLDPFLPLSPQFASRDNSVFLRGGRRTGFTTRITARQIRGVRYCVRVWAASQGPTSTSAQVQITLGLQTASLASPVLASVNGTLNVTWTPLSTCYLARVTGGELFVLLNSIQSSTDPGVAWDNVETYSRDDQLTESFELQASGALPFGWQYSDTGASGDDSQLGVRSRVGFTVPFEGSQLLCGGSSSVFSKAVLTDGALVGTLFVARVYAAASSSGAATARVFFTTTPVTNGTIPSPSGVVASVSLTQEGRWVLLEARFAVTSASAPLYFNLQGAGPALVAWDLVAVTSLVRNSRLDIFGTGTQPRDWTRVSYSTSDPTGLFNSGTVPVAALTTTVTTLDDGRYLLGGRASNFQQQILSQTVPNSMIIARVRALRAGMSNAVAQIYFTKIPQTSTRSVPAFGAITSKTLATSGRWDLLELQLNVGAYASSLHLNLESNNAANGASVFVAWDLVEVIVTDSE